MKEQIESAVAGRDPVDARNIVREILQAKILAALQRAGAMVPLAFHGGTALRFLHALPRWSEDLDFALERPGRGWNLAQSIEAVRSNLARERYDVTTRISTKRTVHSALIAFPGLLHDLGLAGRREPSLRVRIDVDTMPPSGAALATTVVRRHELLNLQHHDAASLLAGKLHAVLARPHAKGRDLHDLVWYLAAPDWPQPNLDMLRSALAQTGWTGSVPDHGNWPDIIIERIADIDWDRAIADVAPFLEDQAHLDLLTRDHALKLLQARRPS